MARPALEVADRWLNAQTAQRGRKRADGPSALMSRRQLCSARGIFFLAAGAFLYGIDSPAMSRCTDTALGSFRGLRKVTRNASNKLIGNPTRLKSDKRCNGSLIPAMRPS